MLSSPTLKLPWHCWICENGDYKEVPDHKALSKYDTPKKLRERMKRHERRAEDRIRRYGLTPLPQLIGTINGEPASIYRVLEEWCHNEFDLRHQLNNDDIGTPREDFDADMKKKSDKVIQNLHIYCSCAARIIQIAFAKAMQRFRIQCDSMEDKEALPFHRKQVVEEKENECAYERDLRRKKRLEDLHRERYWLRERMQKKEDHEDYHGMGFENRLNEPGEDDFRREWDEMEKRVNDLDFEIDCMRDPLYNYLNCDYLGWTTVH